MPEASETVLARSRAQRPRADRTKALTSVDEAIELLLSTLAHAIAAPTAFTNEPIHRFQWAFQRVPLKILRTLVVPLSGSIFSTATKSTSFPSPSACRRAWRQRQRALSGLMADPSAPAPAPAPHR